jgi:hypothetical protein
MTQPRLKLLAKNTNSEQRPAKHAGGMVAECHYHHKTDMRIGIFLNTSSMCIHTPK